MVIKRLRSSLKEGLVPLSSCDSVSGVALIFAVWELFIIII
jgi:hypothetical protein